MKWPAWSARPRVTAIDVPIGSELGGETFTLTGFGFQRYTATPLVDVGGTPATGVVALSNTSLTFVSPAKAKSSIPYAVGVTCGGLRRVLPAIYYSIPDYAEFWWPEVGVTLAGGVVQSWTGRRGTAATQATPAKRLAYTANYNGSPFHALTGTGTQWLASTTTLQAQPLTIAMVFDSQAGATLQFPFGDGAGGGLITLIINDAGQPNKQQVYAGTATPYQGRAEVYAPGISVINYSNAASDSWFVNGAQHVLVASGTQGFTTGLSLLSASAGGAPTIGNLAAFLLFGSQLGAADATIVYAALRHQFGTP